MPYGNLKLANDPLPSMLYIPIYVMIDKPTHRLNGLYSHVVVLLTRDGAGIPHYIHRLPHMHTHFPILRVLVKGLKSTNSFFLKFFTYPVKYIRENLASQETFRTFTG